MSASERLKSLKVADVMNRDVVTIDASQSMCDAAIFLSKSGISAAPVVDEVGHCIGMLSAADFLKRDAGQCMLGESSITDPSHDFVDEGNRPWHIEPLGGDFVSANMSSAVQSVSAEQGLLDAARVLEGAHVHRVVVLDEHNRPIGILSTMDIVSAMINAIDEETSADQ